jgi:hypothetical protein
VTPTPEKSVVVNTSPRSEGQGAATVEKSPKCEETSHRVSKWAWLPFMIVFLLSLCLLVCSFFENIPCGKVPIKIKFSEPMQLAILGTLMGISLLIPFWAHSFKKESEKSHYPLGLPKGSVRAILILIAAAAYVILTIRGNALEDARNIFILLAILYYFSRIAEAKG